MKNNKGSITIALLVATLLIAGGLALWNGKEWKQKQEQEQTFGAFSDPFISLQLAGSPQADYILSTDGTNNSWIVNSGGGAGTGSAWEKVGDNLRPTSSLPILAANGLFASTTALFDNASTTDSLEIGGSLRLNSEYFSDLTGTGLQNLSGVLTTNDGAIDHNALSNYVANEHIDWTAASAGTIDSTNYTDNNTQLSQEQVEDFAGALVTDGTGTHTDITITYQDTTGDVDFVVDTLPNLTGTLDVNSGGTGATTLTDGGILLGSGTGAITALGVASNGQIPIGDGTTDPVLATLTGGTNLSVVNGAGTITLNVDDAFLLNTGDTGTGLYVFTDLRPATINSTTTNIDTLTVNTAINVPVGSIDFSADTNATAGTGITFTNDSIAADLGTSIVTGEITDGTILEADLNVTNAPTDNYVLTYNSAGTNFTWEADQTGAGGGAFSWTDQGWGVSTSTAIGLYSGFISTASSTITSDLRLNTGSLFATTTLVDNLTIGNDITLAGDIISDFSGTGLIEAAGSLQTTLGLTIEGNEITNGTIAVADLASADFGDWTCNGTTCTNDANSIALTTDTTGNYVASITNGTGITGGDGGSEGAALTLAATLGTSIDTSEIDANTIQGSDIEQQNVWADNDIITFDSASDGFTGLTCAEITGSADLCDGNDATGGGGSQAWEDAGFALSTIRPTTSATGLFVDASSTISDLRVTDALNATSSLIDTLTLTNALTVANGGTGAITLTDGGILLGSGTGAITALGVATNGQIPIGDGTTDPVLAVLTGTANEIEITNGAGSITIGIPNAVTLNTLTLTNDLTVANGGTGAGTFTDGGLLLGSGTGAFTALGVATNGQIPIGDGTTDPVLAALTGGTNLTVVNGAGSITLNVDDAFLSNSGDTGTGAYIFSGASLEIPNAAAPTVNAAGEIALDTTDNQLLVSDSGNTARVVQTKKRIWGATIASTTPEFINAGLIPIPVNLDGYTMTEIRCKVDGGTSKVIAVEDASTNSTEDITCATTVTSDDGSITNATVTGAEEMYIDMGATSGIVNYVSISVFGTWTRE